MCIVFPRFVLTYCLHILLQSSYLFFQLYTFSKFCNLNIIQTKTATSYFSSMKPILLSSLRFEFNQCLLCHFTNEILNTITIPFRHTKYSTSNPITNSNQSTQTIHILSNLFNYQFPIKQFNNVYVLIEHY